MSHALIALILINIDAHEGEWCTVAWLAGRLLTPMHAIQPVCDRLVEQGQLLRSFVGGERCYGVNVTAESAPINDARPARAVPGLQVDATGVAPCI